ncbi:MAG: 5'/3'-nucleotidase SurE [Alphaproteobacteria bacterium]
MRILVSNDDGIEAPGLAQLADAARALSGHAPWVVAPDRKISGGSHSITLRRPFTLTQVGEQRFKCSGTPADCMIAARNVVFADQPQPDFVLSGINHGLNVAEDIAYSGTIAIAREAAFGGTPSIAFSRLAADGRDESWVSEWLGHLLPHLWQTRETWARAGHWLSINLPLDRPKGLRATRVGRDKIAVHVDVVETAGPVQTLQTRSGRDRNITGPDDENALIDAGYAAVTWLCWHGQGELPPGLTEDFSA